MKVYSSTTTGISYGVSNVVQVAAVNIIGSGLPSPAANTTTLATGSLLLCSGVLMRCLRAGAALSVSAPWCSGEALTTLTLSWNSVLGATSYQVPQ